MNTLIFNLVLFFNNTAYYFLFNIIPFLFLLGILVIVHEFGHFIVAKLFGIRVEKFSFGFPPKLFGKKIGETEYIVSLVPLGGYVKLAGENDWGKPDRKGEPWEFHSKHPLVKTAVVFAGPFSNFILAILFFFIVNFIGTEVPYDPFHPGKIGRVSVNSAAAEIGLKENDEIVEVDGKKIRSWNDLLELSMLPSKEGKYLLTILSDGKIYKKYIYPKQFGDRKIMGISQYFSNEIGKVAKDTIESRCGLNKGDKIVEIDGYSITQWYDIEEYLLLNSDKEVNFKVMDDKGKYKFIKFKPSYKTIKAGFIDITPQSTVTESNKFIYTNVIKEVMPGSIADKAGLLKGDKIIKVDELEVTNYVEIYTYLINKKNQTVKFKIIRDNKIIEKNILIDEKEVKIGYLNLIPKYYKEKYDFTNSAKLALTNSFKYVVQTFDVLYRLVTQKLSAFKVMGGPISIFKFSGMAAQSGLTKFFLLIAIISINLAVINLFPVPVLDGGVILLFIYELLTKKQVSEKILERGQQIGWALIIGLSIFVIYIDISREILNR